VVFSLWLVLFLRRLFSHDEGDGIAKDFFPECGVTQEISIFDLNPEEGSIDPPRLSLQGSRTA